MDSRNKAGNQQSVIIGDLTKRNRLIDLSVALLRFQILPRNATSITRYENEMEKQVILVAQRGSVFIMPNGKRIFSPDKLIEIEEFAKNQFRIFRSIQNDALWALLVGLSGFLGILFVWMIPRIPLGKDRSKVKRFIDEQGDIVYIAKSPDGSMAHLLSVSSDRKNYLIHEPLTNAICDTGHYVVRFTYPASVATWKEMLGLEVDPKVEVMLDPAQV